MAVCNRRFGQFHWTGQQTYRCPAICRMPHFVNHLARDDLGVIEHLLKIIDRTASHVLGLELFQPESRRTRSDDRVENFRELRFRTRISFVRNRIIRQLFTSGNCAEAPELFVISRR